MTCDPGHTYVSVLTFFFFLFSFRPPPRFFFFFFNDTATTEIYTLSLHDALPIYSSTRDTVQELIRARGLVDVVIPRGGPALISHVMENAVVRSEEHTSELQSHLNLVCRLLLEKKKQRNR